MKRMINMVKCISLSAPLLSFLLMYAVNAHALVLTRGTPAADFTGSLGTVQVNYVDDAPLSTGGLTGIDTITIFADEVPPLPDVPVERVQYDVYNISGTAIDEFTVTFPAGTVVESAYEPLEYYDSVSGITVDTGGIAYSTLFNAGYGTYHYNSTSSWEIEYQPTSVTFHWVGAGAGLPPGGVIGQSDVPTSLSSFAIEFQDGTALGLQPASFSGGVLAVFTSNGSVLSAVPPGVSVNGTTYYSTTPLPNVLVELIDYAQSPTDPAAYSMNSDGSGVYDFPNVADGEYWLKWNGPSPEYAGWLATPITVAGSAITHDLYVEKNISLDTPPNNATVTTPNPQLCWTPSDPAEATYNISIWDASSVLHESATGLTATCYTVSTPLLDGSSYHWQMTQSFDSAGHPVGWSNEFNLITNFTCPDADSDGVCDTEDNCPNYYNPPQADNDGDLVGDACDNCSFIANGPEDIENQVNTDGDEMGDICDPCPTDATNACDQAGKDDGLTVVFNNPTQPVEIIPGDPVPVQLCQQNPEEEPIYTIFDCFTASYKISANNIPLDTMHKDRTLYIIGTPDDPDDDVDIIQPGEELCITCNLDERVEIPLPAVGQALVLTGDICSTNNIADPELQSDGGCLAGDDSCIDIKIGTICAPLPETKVVNRETVMIDIKPGAFPNTINLGSNGKLPVAVLSSEFFDATTLDPLTVTLADAGVAFKGKSENPMTSIQDVNEDGFPDLVVHIDTQGLSLTDGDVKAELKAEVRENGVTTFYVRGEDSIRVVPAQ